MNTPTILHDIDADLNPRRIQAAGLSSTSIARPPCRTFLIWKLSWCSFPSDKPTLILLEHHPKSAGNFQLGLDYKSSLFKAETIRGWMRHYEVLLRTLWPSLS